MDHAYRLCLALYATRLAAVGSRLPADEEVARGWRLRGDGPRFACTLAAFGGQSTRSEGNHTGLPHPAIHAGERLSGRLRRGEAQEGYEGTRGGGYLGTLARLACDTSQRAGARVCGRVGRDCARGHGRVGGTGIRGPRIYRREASYGSGDSWHEVGSGQVRRGEAGLRAATAPLGRGAGFRMGIAISTANEGLREAARHFGGAALCRLRLPLPPASDRHPRRGFITPSRQVPCSQPHWDATSRLLLPQILTSVCGVCPLSSTQSKPGCTIERSAAQLG